MAEYQYQQILNMYTQMIPFSRYDVLLYELGRLKLTDIKGESHVLNRFYRSYNTYRKDISPDVSTLKINETYNDQDKIEENYFNLESLDTSYVFDGIVLSKKFATNGNEMSLEDLFAEFYYEYLTAVDSSYLYSPDYGQTYYFNQSYVDPVTQEEVVGGTYNILPVGSTYRDDDGIVTSIDYDGTYVPTIGELLSGKLYLVIQSEGKPARKIMFNHHNLPTLFINDDKFYTTDEYIMNDNQLMRLCDVKLYSRLGVRISWRDIAYLDGKTVADMLAGIGSNDHNLWYDGKIGTDQAFFRIYYRAWFENSASAMGESTIFITGRKEIRVGTNESSLDLYFNDGFVNQPDNNDWVWDGGPGTAVYSYDPVYFLKNQDKAFLNNTTGYIPAANIEDHTIRVHIQFGVSLILKGYTLIEQDEDTYALQWYKYTEESAPTTVTAYYNIFNDTSYNTAYLTIGFNNGLQLTYNQPISSGGSTPTAIPFSLLNTSTNTSFSLQDIYMRDSNNNEYTKNNGDFDAFTDPNPWKYNTYNTVDIYLQPHANKKILIKVTNDISDYTDGTDTYTNPVIYSLTLQMDNEVEFSGVGHGDGGFRYGDYENDEAALPNGKENYAFSGNFTILRGEIRANRNGSQQITYNTNLNDYFKVTGNIHPYIWSSHSSTRIDVKIKHKD